MTAPEELREAAAAWCAGELEPGDGEAFEALLADDATLRGEVDFWRSMQAELPAACREGVAPPRGPGLIAVCRARIAADRERESERRRGPLLLAASGWGLALAAGFLLLVVLTRQRSPAETVSPERVYAWSDLGESVVAPEDWQRHPNLQPPPRALHVGDRPVVSSVDLQSEPGDRPWLGIWTRPIRVVHDEVDREEALQIVRIVEGGPAHAAGLLPGDVLLQFGPCPVYSRYCIIHAIDQGSYGSGDLIPLRYWRPAEDRIVETRLRLARILE